MKRDQLAMRRAKLGQDSCRVCGSITDLHTHHIVPRSLTQCDDQENLIVLCGDHHRAVHQHKLDLGIYLTPAQGAKAVLLLGTVYRAHSLLYPSENPRVAA